MAITGLADRWCEPFARGDAERGTAPWPLDAMVAENGAVAYTMNATRRHASSSGVSALSKLYLQDEATRHATMQRLQRVAAQALSAVPGTTLAQDSAGRETDIAIDHSEFAHLSPSEINAVLAIMRAAGLHATVSSIHINGWLGTHNKLVGAHWIVLRSTSVATWPVKWIAGPMSATPPMIRLMFEAFDNSVGVANLRRFEADLTHPPRYIAARERGAGFAEVADALLAAR